MTRRANRIRVMSEAARAAKYNLDSVQRTCSDQALLPGNPIRYDVNDSGFRAVPHRDRTAKHYVRITRLRAYGFIIVIILHSYTTANTQHDTVVDRCP